MQTEASKPAAKERGMLFSRAMALRVFLGAKTETRRPVMTPRWAEPGTLEIDEGEALAVAKVSGCLSDVECPYAAGDRIWVREAWAQLDQDWRVLPPGEPPHRDFRTVYASDHQSKHGDGPARIRWTPAIHMPRWATRNVLSVLEVSCTQLCTITPEQIRSEGIGSWTKDGALFKYGPGEPGDPGAWEWVDMPRSPHEAFERLWNEQYGGTDFAWAKNPWVWTIRFNRIGDGVLR